MQYAVLTRVLDSFSVFDIMEHITFLNLERNLTHNLDILKTSVLQWIRYPIPNKKDLLNRLYDSKIFSKFDMKSGFLQIQIAEQDRYKTGFNVPFGHYEWNVMPFGLKNAPSEFQNIMNDILNAYSSFTIVYIDDVLVFSKDLDQHFKHLNIFLNVIT